MGENVQGCVFVDTKCKSRVDQCVKLKDDLVVEESNVGGTLHLLLCFEEKKRNHFQIKLAHIV